MFPKPQPYALRVLASKASRRYFMSTPHLSILIVVLGVGLAVGHALGSSAPGIKQWSHGSPATPAATRQLNRPIQAATIVAT
jgi:hypothetical protein